MQLRSEVGTPRRGVRGRLGEPSLPTHVEAREKAEAVPKFRCARQADWPPEADSYDCKVSKISAADRAQYRYCNIICWERQLFCEMGFAS